MNYGEALSKLITVGGRARRYCWPKDTFVYLGYGSAPRSVELNHFDGKNHVGAIPTTLFDVGDQGTSVRNPTLNRVHPDGSHEIGFAPGQVDQLSGDWTVE